MRALIGALAFVLLAPGAITALTDIQSIQSASEQNSEMTIVAFTTLTFLETPTTPALSNGDSDAAVAKTEASSSTAQASSLSPKSANEHNEQSMDRDSVEFKKINLHLPEHPNIEAESTSSDESTSLSEQSTEIPASSAPRVLSVNVVMPTFAIKFTEGSDTSNTDTAITIGSFINGLDESAQAAPIFRVANVPPESQKASSTAEEFTEALVTSSHLPDSKTPSVSAVQRHQITLDEMELLSILHIQNAASLLATKTISPSAGFYGLPPPTPPSVKGVGSPPFGFSTHPQYSMPHLSRGPLPQLGGSSVVPSRLLPSQQHKVADALRPISLSLGATHKSPFTGLPPDPAVSDYLDGAAEYPAVETTPVPSPRDVAAQKPYMPLVSSPPPAYLPHVSTPPTVITPSSPPTSSLPAWSHFKSSHSAQKEAQPSIIHESQQPVITILLHPTHAVLPAQEPQISMTTESILMLPSPPDSISVTPPPPVAEKPPAMLVDSLSQQNTPIIPFISNGSRLPVPTPQEDKEQGGKGDINTNGLASILENVFHIPSNAITINGKPITESNSITVGGKGQGSIVIVGGKGVAGSKNNDGDDDDDDDNDPDADSDNESTTTHMLDVDRVRNHGRIGSKIVDFDNDTIAPSKQTDGNSSGSDSSNDDDGDSSNSDDDSDEESDISGSVKSTSVTSSTPTLSASSSTDSVSASSESATLSSTDDTKSSSASRSATLSLDSSSASSEDAQSTSSLSLQTTSTPSTHSGKALSKTETEGVESASSLLSLARLLSA